MRGGVESKDQIVRYRAIAERMRGSAGRIADATIKQQYLDLAIQYEQLADDVARSGQNFGD
jgi:hypothetical protein